MSKFKKISLLIVPLGLVLIFSVGFGLAATGPELSIPSSIPADPNDTVNVPVVLASNGSEVASMAFSIDYDETWLAPDITNAYSLTWNLPPGVTGGCSNDFADLDGEFDCVVLPPYPLKAIPDSTILTVTLKTKAAPTGTVADVKFSTAPAPSFGDTDGQSLVGASTDGSVLIGAEPPSPEPGDSYLPIIYKNLPNPTATPTPTPTATSTGIVPTATNTPTATPTSTATPDQPACENLIKNGGFEEVGVAWVLPETEYKAKYTDGLFYTAPRSMRTGINPGSGVQLYSYSSAWQKVTIPTDAVSAELTFIYYPWTSEPFTTRLASSIFNQFKDPLGDGMSDPPFDQQMALILEDNDADLPTHDRTLWSVLSNTKTWAASQAFDLMDYKGDTIWVAFTTYNDGFGGKTALYVDEVVLEVCK